MPYGTPNSHESSGSTYRLQLTHDQDTTVPIVVDIPSLGDSGADSSDGNVIFQAIVDLFDGQADFTIVSASKIYSTDVECTPTL